MNSQFYGKFTQLWGFKISKFQKTIAVDYTRIPYMYILVLLMCNRHEKPGVGP